MADEEKPKKKPSKLIKLTPTDEEVKAPKKSIKDAMAAVNRKNQATGFNKSRLASDLKPPEVIPTGILALDYALNIGGFPRGRIIQLYGPEASWKSTVALRTIAECQKRGGWAVWIDAEMTFDPIWAKRNGVDTEQLIVVPPDTMEEGLQLIEDYAREGADIIVLDSLIALAPTKELYTDKTKKTAESFDKEQMGLFGRIMSKWLRRVMKVFAEHRTLFIAINQIRSSLSQYGPPETVPGGKALKFYNSISIKLKRMTANADQVLDANKNVIGAKYEFKIEKTKHGIIGRGGDFTLVGTNIDNFTTLRDIAIELGIIEKVNASNYMVAGEKINGKENVRIALIKNKELCAQIEEACRSKMGFNISDFNDDENAAPIQLDMSDEEMDAADEDIENDTAEEQSEE